MKKFQIRNIGSDGCGSYYYVDVQDNEDAIEKCCEKEFIMIKEKKPITHMQIGEMRMHKATEDHISKLPVGYMITHDDILWLNYVYIYLSQGRGRGYTTEDIITAIGRFVTSYGLRHFDPYELWIDAGYCDSSLRPIQKKE